MKGYATLPNCVTCGRFCTEEPGASWRMVYSGGPIPMPDREQIQCRSCTEQHGPLQGQAGIRIEWVDSCDYVPGDEVESIMACITPTDVLDEAILRAEEARTELNTAIERATVSREDKGDSDA